MLMNARMGVKTLPESKCPELLANYCDMLLRKTALSKKLTSEEVERKLREVVRTLQSAPVIIIDRVAGDIIHLVSSVCVRVFVSVRLSVGALLFEPFDL